jgi:hypothetical protein
MPNPRAQKPLSYEQIIKDAKSLGVPAQALLDALAGGVKGSVSATVGAPADIYNLASTLTGNRLGNIPYGSEDISKMLPDVIPTQDKSRQHSAEYGETMGSFIPTPISGQALKGAVKLGAKGARALGEEAGRRAVMGESFTPFVNTAIPQTHVVKPKGGNWLNNSVEEGLYPLTKNILNEQGIRNLGERQGQEVVDRYMEGHKKDVALNNWVNKNLTNYVKKEMGTPEDPVRKLAEEGILHSPMEAGRYRVPENVKQARFNAGFPIEGMGQSDLAKAWEHLSDASIKPQTVEQLINPQFQKEGNVNSNIYQAERNKANNPWLEKLDPKDIVHETRDPFNNLGFDHILDVLKEDITNGRLRPESLKNVSMEQAVRRAHEYDQELAKKMEDARAKNLENMTVHKEYPDGMKWVQLDKPGQFAAESDSMGHSVRGYEPPKGHPDWIPESGDSGSEYYGHGGWEAIKNKEAKVYSLVDPKGNPHTTVEVKANQNPYPVSGEAFAMLPQSTKAQYGQYVREWRQRNPHIEDLTDEHTTQALKEAGVPPQPDSITQIKGKGNLKPVDTYIPYVQDFVKSGNWGDVGDLHNTGLFNVQGKYFTEPELTEAAKKYGRMGVQDTPWEVARQRHIDAGVPEEEALANWVDAFKDGRGRLDIPPEPPVEATPNLPPPETPQFKRGGKVHITDNLDTQWAETAFKPHMAGGGEIAKLVEKAIKIPTKFERATPLTKEAIDAMAERMAPQVNGEFVRAKPSASNPNPSTSVTGKSQKQFENEKNLGLVTRDIKPTVKPREFDYTDPKNKGKVLIGTSGDVTPTNKEILEIKGVPIEPTEQQGGGEYGLYNKGIYAASNDQAQAYQAQAKRASEAYGDAEPLLHYHRMTDEANLYAMHHLQTLLNYMKPEELAKIDPSKYGQLVKLIQEKDVGFGLHPQFGGFEDPLSINLHAQIDPDFRRHVGKILQMPSISKNFGLRSGLDVLAATSEPELRNLEAGSGGFAIAPIDIKTPYTPYTSPNRTYETDILGGEVQRSKYPLTYQLAYPDATQFLIENPPEKGANNVFGRLNFTKPRQIIDQQFQDEVGQYMDKMKELTGKKEGGEVHMAGGGSASKALEAMLAEAPELANTIRGLFKAEAPTLGSLVDKLRTPDRQSVLPMPNRWFLDPENHPEVQGLVQKVLDVNGMNRSDFHSGAYVDPKTGKIIDTQIHNDVGVAIDPITNRPVMTTGGVSGMEQLPSNWRDVGSATKSNLVKQGKFQPVGGDPILNDIGFLSTIEKSGAGHKYGLGMEYANPTMLHNTLTGDNPTLRPQSYGDLFGIGDVVGQMQINKNSPVHDVYEKLLVAPKGSDVQGVKLSKKKGGKVQITNNPDTQWAELQFQRK